MRKIISYSLFGARELTFNKWLFNAYVTGLYWNVRMNKLIYPDWTTHVNVDSGTFSMYDTLIKGLQEFYGITFDVNPPSVRCMSMLWRMKPIFEQDVEYVICRDADALTSYKEAQCVSEFVATGMDVHGITDNTAHSIPVLGGLCGFRGEPMRERYGSWEKMIGETRVPINDHGTDQNFLMQNVYTDFKYRYFGHILNHNLHIQDSEIVRRIPDVTLDGVDPKLWESNLCACFMGSAGVNNMETIRFFQRFSQDTEFEKDIALRYREIFYWLI